MKYVLGFDPGKTCGWALLHVQDDEPAYLAGCDEVPAVPGALYKLMWEQLLQVDDCVVVCEDWVRNDRSVDARMALHPTGMMMMLAHELDHRFVLQDRQIRLSIGDTEAGLGPYWRPNLKKHDDRRQALRHALAYVVHTMHHLPTTQLLFPR